MAGGPGCVGQTAVLGVLGLLAAAAGICSLLLAGMAPWASAWLLGLFLLAGPGAAITAHLGVSRAAATALVVPLSTSVVVLVATVPLLLGTWRPRTLLVLLVVAVAASSTAAVQVSRRYGLDVLELVDALLSAVHVPRRAAAPLVLTGIAVTCWAASLPGIRRAGTSDYGLLAAAPWSFRVALVLALAAFVGAVRGGRGAPSVLALLAVVVVWRGATSAAVSVPMYPWTYKHIGVADYVLRNGHLAGDVDIYNQWPGMFAAAAWFSAVSHAGLLQVARFTPLVVHVLLALLVLALARRVGCSWPAASTAGLIAEACNWVGQDYFAPQAVAMLLALAVLLLLLSSRSGVVWWALLPFSALTVTHQLTPYWLAGLAVVLALLRVVRPWWISLVMVLIVVGYLLLHLDYTNRLGLFSGFDVLSNAQSNISSGGSPGRHFTSAAARGTSLALWAAAAGCAIWWWRQSRRRALVLAAAAFSPFPLLAVQNYGGEAIFRVLLYSLAGCALLVGEPCARLLRASWARAASAASALLVLGALALQAYFGTWFVYRVSPVDLAVSERLLEDVPPPAYLSMVSPMWPVRPTGAYVPFAEFDSAFDSPVSGYDPASTGGITTSLAGRDFSTAADLAALDEVVSARSAPTYLIISEQMEVYSDYFGVSPHGSLGRLRAALDASGGWQRVVDEPGVTVFRSPGAAAP
ncbi:hypothetical protein [Kineococcus glutinatus]